MFRLEAVASTPIMALVGPTQVASALNVTPSWVHKLVKQGMPKEAHGQFDLGKCMLWYIRFLQEALKRQEGGDGTEGRSASSNLKEKRAQVLELEVKKREIQLENARKGTVLIEEAGKIFDDIFLRLRTRMMASVNRNAQHMLNLKTVAVATKKLDALVKDALNEAVKLADQLDRKKKLGVTGRRSPRR